MMSKSIYVIGDSHGDWGRLLSVVRNKCEIDSIVISVGDCGIGFHGPLFQLEELKVLNSKFKEYGIDFYTIRGNHDDPKYFDGSYNFDNLHLIKDGTVLNLEGLNFLFIGGAVSVDRKQRTKGIDYWENELFIKPDKKFENIDVLISHTAGSVCEMSMDNNIVNSWIKIDHTLKDDLIKERKLFDEFYTDLIENNLNFNRHYIGHFHESKKFGKRVNIAGKILNCFEIQKI